MSGPTARSCPAARSHRSLAQRLTDLVATIAEDHPRPARWRGELDPAAPACCAFFLISAASVHLVEAAVAHPRIDAVDVSIEAGGVFAAIEASIATGRPQIVICGSGPGTLGVLWAIPAARAQGASLLVLAPRTPPWLAGTTSIQEASTFEPVHTVGAELYDEAFHVSDVREMPRIAIALRHLFARPQGAVVQLTAPTHLLDRRCPSLRGKAALEIAQPAPSEHALTRIAEWLDRPGGPPAFVLGSGCNLHRDALGTVIDRLGAVHVTTPGALGLLPGSLGLIGNAGLPEAAARLRAADPRCVFVLATRLGMASGGGDARLLPRGCPVVHVDISPYRAIGAAPATRDHPLLCVPAELSEFIAALGELATSR